ncbi:MAG: type II secretion system F family protein [Candidatus Sumerlaeia bacterium]|nr:type II secretion system F family protein [Candidatus Sumerlaeia bacterium]
MPEYLYEALDKGGKQVRGIIEAPNEDSIIEKLRGMGYYPLRVNVHRKKASEIDILAMPGLKQIFHRVKRKHIMTFTRQLATLIDAGLPILRSLRILEEQVESVVFKEIIAKIAKDIEGGSTLSDAMAKHPKVFDNLYVAMVRAGEIGGVLEAVLNRLAEFQEKRAAMMGKVRSAMMYPTVVMVIATLIVGFILVKIIPKFVDIFAQLGADLPLPTQILVNVSNVITHHFVVVALCVFAFIMLLRQINKTKQGKFVFDTTKLKLPVFGIIFLKVAIVRFAGTLSTLINAGVPILQAIDIVRETSGNEVISRAMEKVYNSIKDGETIHEPMRESKIFPPLVCHMVAVGEETGAIDQMLQKVAEAYEREVDDTINALTSIIEPVLIVFLGVIVGTIVICLYLPLFTIPKLIK